MSGWKIGLWTSGDDDVMIGVRGQFSEVYVGAGEARREIGMSVCGTFGGLCLACGEKCEDQPLYEDEIGYQRKETSVPKTM